MKTKPKTTLHAPPSIFIPGSEDDCAGEQQSSPSRSQPLPSETKTWRPPPKDDSTSPEFWDNVIQSSPYGPSDDYDGEPVVGEPNDAFDEVVFQQSSRLIHDGSVRTMMSSSSSIRDLIMALPRSSPRRIPRASCPRHESDPKVRGAVKQRGIQQYLAIAECHTRSAHRGKAAKPSRNQSRLFLPCSNPPLPDTEPAGDDRNSLLASAESEDAACASTTTPGGTTNKSTRSRTVRIMFNRNEDERMLQLQREDAIKELDEAIDEDHAVLQQENRVPIKGTQGHTKSGRQPTGANAATTSASYAASPGRQAIKSFATARWGHSQSTRHESQDDRANVRRVAALQDDLVSTRRALLQSMKQTFSTGIWKTCRADHGGVGRITCLEGDDSGKIGGNLFSSLRAQLAKQRNSAELQAIVAGESKHGSRRTSSSRRGSSRAI